MAQNHIALVKSTSPRIEPRMSARPLSAAETKGLADPLPDLWAMFGITATASGLTISSDQALQMPVVASAIRVISEAAACLKICVKTVGADGRETAVTGHRALPFLTRDANDWTSGYELIRDLAIDALTDDRGGLVWVNRVGGEVVELIRYRSGVINVQYDSDTGEPRYTRGGHALANADMIHLRAPFGRAPLSLAREAIATGIVLATHAAQLFGNGARPSGALRFPKGMGEEAVKRARAAWRATHEGQDAGGKTAILYDDAEFVPYTFASTDAQFIENRKFQILEVARAFRVPPSMVFDLDRATWSNTEQMGDEFLIYCLEPWLRALEGSLTRALIARGENAVIRFERDDMTRADLQTRAAAVNSLIAAQVLNPNEGREWLGMERRAGGDDYLNPNITASPGGDPALSAKDAPDGP